MLAGQELKTNKIGPLLEQGLDLPLLILLSSVANLNVGFALEG